MTCVVGSRDTNGALEIESLVLEPHLITTFYRTVLYCLWTLAHEPCEIVAVFYSKSCCINEF